MRTQPDWALAPLLTKKALTRACWVTNFPEWAAKALGIISAEHLDLCDMLGSNLRFEGHCYQIAT